MLCLKGRWNPRKGNNNRLFFCKLSFRTSVFLIYMFRSSVFDCSMSRSRSFMELNCSSCITVAFSLPEIEFRVPTSSIVFRMLSYAKINIKGLSWFFMLPFEATCLSCLVQAMCCYRFKLSFEATVFTLPCKL